MGVCVLVCMHMHTVVREASVAEAKNAAKKCTPEHHPKLHTRQVGEDNGEVI